MHDLSDLGSRNESGIENIGRQVRVELPDAGAAPDQLEGADSPEAIRTALEQCFLLEEAFLAGLAEGDKRQGAFMYNVLCKETAYQSAFRLIAAHRSSQGLDQEPTIRLLDRVSAAARRSPDYDVDPWAIGFDARRVEVDALVVSLEAEL